jgi:hypothetical protein
MINHNHKAAGRGSSSGVCRVLQAKEAKEEEEWDAVKARLGPKLDQWAQDGAGKLRNVRTLLSTMHTVLWEGEMTLQRPLG